MTYIFRNAVRILESSAFAQRTCRSRFLFKYFIVVVAISTIMLLMAQMEMSKTFKRSDLQVISDKNVENTWCRIPDIDPFNSEVQKYYDKNYKVSTECRLTNQNTYVEGSNLVVQLKDASDIRMCYIKRVDDFSIDVTSNCKLLKPDTTEDTERCLLSANSGKLIYIEENNSTSFVVIDNQNKQCSENETFKMVDGKFIHSTSKKCMEPQETRAHSPLVLKAECQNNSVFEMTSDGKMKHIASGMCAYFNFKNGKINIGDCATYKEIPFHPSFDVNMKVPLTGEFVKISFVKNNRKFEEFHANILPPTEPRGIRRENELDILMLMMDSLSRANAQRQLFKSYEYLKNDPNTVILKGHTINGDGTTAQLVGMFTGLAEDKTPEARRSMPGAKPVDDWPFIFKNLHKKGYITTYSEDSPSVSTFQMRLTGFQRPPTHKYLRPFWLALTSKENVCDHKLAINYVKDFWGKYKDYKKFAFLNMGLAHNDMNAFRNIDDDLYTVLEFMKQSGALNRTAVFVFGDHGIRAGGYRSTIVGKLEERLPLMTLTLPEWFKKKFPQKFANLQNNGEVLTTHYDIHATLLHLLNLEKLEVTNTYEKSLFTDISSLHRTCADANIESHWCPCMQYESVPVNSSIIARIIKKTIAYINKELNTDSADSKCSKLFLSNVMRARIGAHNKKMQQFVHTLRNDACDSCALKLDSKIPIKESYEITFSVKPSGGIFESSATVLTLEGNEIIDVKPTISRLNLYGDQPRCIAKKFPHLRKYCFCKT